MSLSIERPSCLDMAPEWLEAFLRSCPKSGSGVHSWLAKATHRSFAYLDASEQAKALSLGRTRLRQESRAQRDREHGLEHQSQARGRGGQWQFVSRLAPSRSCGDRRPGAIGNNGRRTT